MLFYSYEILIFAAKQEEMKQRTTLVLIAVILILAAALSRVALFPWNFSPVVAMALFSGAVIKDKRLAFLMPLLAMFLSDLIFEVSGLAQGFWGWGQLIGYGIFALITVFGFSMKKINIPRIAVFTLASTFIFFFLSNSSVWLFESVMYPRSFAGYAECIAAGVPFLKNNLVTDLAYSTLFFGSYWLLENFAFKKSFA